MDVGYDKPLYILTFDDRCSLQKALFGWSGTLAPEQTARIAATKQVHADDRRPMFELRVPMTHGQSAFWDALVALRDGRNSHEQAPQVTADRYREWIRVFVSARKSR
jgi:hypothetical protein